ncbi:SNF2 helicase associated domain-containing protein [Mucilaginibacter sp. Bleaf8]|nr:DEAD/DEAH box helicase [Mucilaginibacter sp. Bleaf8]MBS7563208.1 SNF2 helicase associated domain-containing protein [Mucilaginibacter sp. Bleaf8]
MRAGNEEAQHSLVFSNITVAQLSEMLIARYTSGNYDADSKSWQQIKPLFLEINQGAFSSTLITGFPTVTLVQQATQLHISCQCKAVAGNLCEHQALVLTAIIRKDDYRAFYDYRLRHDKLRKFAVDYGLQHEKNLDDFFSISITNSSLVIAPKSPALLPVTKESLTSFREMIVPEALPIATDDHNTDIINCVVIKQYKYYKYLFVELYQAKSTKDGKIKNPLTLVPPLDKVWQTEDHGQLRFFTGVNQFQNHLNIKRSETDIAALRAITKNPLGYSFFYHNSDVSDKVTAASIEPTVVKVLPGDLKLTVTLQNQFYEVSGSVKISGKVVLLKDVQLCFTYFVKYDKVLYLVDSLQVINVIELFAKKPDNLLIHQSKFPEFKTQVLSKLEDKIKVEYRHIKPASQSQLEQQGFTGQAEKIIYLSDFGAHVMLIPVMRYGEVEISIRTKRQIYSTDERGREFMVYRNEAEEDDFTSLLIRQHPHLEEQLESDLQYFYLHKKFFLDEDWFLNVFEEWRNHHITILGFNELEGNKLNPHKVKISIKVLSGINWFNTEVGVRFGRTRAALKKIYRAVKNKSKYIQLDDGTLGILPAEWIEKFSKYFNAGEIADEHTIRIPKINFTAIEQLYDAEQLDDGVQDELNIYRNKLANFDAIQHVAVPPDLCGELRPYQRQGLNWLNFLDNFNFGGCLADDMGLGKSIQILAFILLQRHKVSHNTNLLIVPTSLIFNWQQEVEKFAPSLKVCTLYGSERTKQVADFDKYEVVLTTYGTLLSDVNFLKDYNFNYIFLDESQNIKNPESQRYKAVRLLNSRNKIVITGTPVENNTFDLYAQLSFACPGLLGSKQYFKDIYSSPIDSFKSNKRTAELQEKIKPFILRRTKQQVATELPEKTDMVLYCEMKPQQRKIYDAYEKEFREYISATTGDVLKKSSMNVLKGLTRLRQICNSPLLIKGEKMPGDASAKIDMLLEQIEGKQAHHKILVFSQFVTMLDLIKAELIKRGIGYSYLTGQTRNREGVVNAFQTNDNIRVFLISLKAGGTGLNLTEADYVYLVDPWWNPAVENQAIDRCHRIGQDKNIVAVRLICPGTVEEKMMVMQQTKRDLANDLIRTDASVIRSLNKEDLLQLLNHENLPEDQTQ